MAALMTRLRSFFSLSLSFTTWDIDGRLPEQQFHRLDAGIGMKTMDHNLLLKTVDQCQHDHPLVVGHINWDNCALIGFGNMSRSKVDRLIQSTSS